MITVVQFSMIIHIVKTESQRGDRGRPTNPDFLCSVPHDVGILVGELGHQIIGICVARLVFADRL
jgi:hypothetical protein